MGAVYVDLPLEQHFLIVAMDFDKTGDMLLNSTLPMPFAGCFICKH